MQKSFKYIKYTHTHKAKQHTNIQRPANWETRCLHCNFFKIKKQLAIFSSTNRLFLIKVKENFSFQRLNQALSQTIPEPL